VNITARPFDEHLLHPALDLVLRISELSEVVWGWEAARFVDWRWGNNILKLEKQPRWFAQNCVVFEDNNRIKALAVSEYGGQDACILTAGRDRELARHVVDWLLRNWAEQRGGLAFDVSHNEYWLTSLLSDKGFSETGYTGHEWEYDLLNVPSRANLPPGYRVESLAENGRTSLRGIAEVVKMAFGSKESIDSIVKVLTSLEGNPLFKPELNLFARSPDGTIVSYCRGTVNPENGVAAIDPVCTHPDHRRKGLARAVVLECFRRQAELEGRRCYIGSAPMPAPGTFLYRGLHPTRFFTASRWKIEVSSGQNPADRRAPN